MGGTQARCWAAGVTPCEGPITEEHYVTYGLFDSALVTVASGPLAKEGPRKIPAKRLITNSLCEGHNGGLADLDQAGIDFLNVLRKVAEVHTHRTRMTAIKGPRNWKHLRFTVDGCRLERWLLKSAFGAAPVFREHIGDWRPSPDQAALALGTRPFTRSLGMHAVAAVGSQVTNEEHINFGYGRRSPGGEPIAFTMALFGGYRLACMWEPARNGDDFVVFDGVGERAQLLERPTRFQYAINSQAPSISIQFDWSGRWDPRKNPDVVALRQLYRPPPR